MSATFASSARQLIGVQLVSRLFTFVLNQALLRFVSPTAFGTAAIQFELLLSTILFLSREGVRNAVLRSWPKPSDSRTITITNVTAIPILIGIPLSLGIPFIYCRLASSMVRSQPYFQTATAAYGLAAAIELLAEPMHIRTMGELRTPVRVRAEGLGVVCKTGITFAAMLLENRLTRRNDGSIALMAFACGQLTYSGVLLVVYLFHYRRLVLWPRRADQDSLRKDKQGLVLSMFDRQVFNLSFSMTAQSIFKHFLTEGDKLIVSTFSPLQDQGGYAVAVNYGSLVARIVFQPIEEVLRLYFSKTFAPHSTTENTPHTRSITSGALDQAFATLKTVISVQLAASLLLLCFAPPSLPIVLALILPRRYQETSAPAVLQAWIWYIPILMVNGGLEAFFASVATPNDLQGQSRYMLVCSGLYVLATVSLYALPFGFGDVSLVYANIFNLSLRIVYCARFASAFYASQNARLSRQSSASRSLNWRHTLPRMSLVCAAVSSRMLIAYNVSRADILYLVERHGYRSVFSAPVIVHIVWTGFLACGCGLIWWLGSGRYISSKRSHD